MQLPYAVPLPDEGSVFDYYLDLKHYHFLTWAERRSESRRHSGGYVALPEVRTTDDIIIVGPIFFLNIS